MARTNNPAPHAARSASGAATTPAPALVAPAADHSPAAGVLAALAAEPAGATVAVIAEIPDAGRPADDGQPAAEPADGTADAGRSAPVTAHHRGPTGGSRPRAAGPDPAVTAEAAGNVAAIAQAADEAGKALAAGNLDVALAALEDVSIGIDGSISDQVTHTLILGLVPA